MSRLLTLLARLESRQTTHGQRAALGPLLVLSDAARGYDRESQIQRCPQGAAFIERTFGRPVLPKPNHKSLCLATCTPRQARRAQLDGIHWPQKRLKLRHRSATKGLIETCSAHSGLSIAIAAQLNLDAILVSTAFSSDSPSATRPLGAIRLAKLKRAFPKAKIYALGGITFATTKLLMSTQITGVALVSFKDEVSLKTNR